MTSRVRATLRYLRNGLAVLVAGLLILAAIYRSDIARVLHLPSSVYAKEYCSCHFVVGLTDEQCHAYASVLFPVYDFSLDEKTGIVRVSSMGYSDAAQFLGSPFGCRLMPDGAASKLE